MSSGEPSRKTPRGQRSSQSPGRGAKGVAATAPSGPRRTPPAPYGSSSSSYGTGGASRTAAPGGVAPYTHSSTPTAVRSRSIGSLPWQGRQDSASVSAAGGAAVASGDDEYGDGFGSDADQSRDTVSRAAAERSRLRAIINGDSGNAAAGTAAAVTEDPGGPAPTEQDASCEVAAAGIIVACQDSGVCDVAMRGVTRLPPSLHKFFRAEGGLVSDLQLQGNRLTAAPPLELLQGLTRLDLSANMLSSVPASLGKLRRLQFLDLSRNVQLVVLPSELCDLTALTSLDLSHNALECLPLRMGQLNRLVEMRLDNNQLSYLPPSCAGLPSLTALHASYNRLTALPSELGSASSLTGIFVNHNKLTALPATLGQLRQRLAELQLHNNELTVLPRELGLLASLTRITTGCNPLVHPPPAVARKGVAAVREYLLADWGGSEMGGSGTGAGGDTEAAEDLASGEAAEAEQGAGQGPGGGGGQRRRRLVLSAACKACADKDDRIEELGQLLREARERVDRTERQLDHAREQLHRQARDLAQQAQRAVETDGEISRLNRRLTAVSASGITLLGGKSTAAVSSSSSPASRASGGGRGEELEAHLRGELREARGAAEVASAAAETAEREAKRLRKELDRREQDVAAYRERSEELAAALERERERCNAAVAAATEASRKLEELQPAVKERDELRRKVETVEAANKEAWRAAQVARDGHLSSEANADLMLGKLSAAEAINRRLTQQVQEERAAAARAAAEAESRQAQLQLEINRLRADLAALMSEREVLHGLARPPARAAGMGVAAGAGGGGGALAQSAPAMAEAAGTARSSWALPQRI